MAGPLRRVLIALDLQLAFLVLFAGKFGVAEFGADMDQFIEITSLYSVPVETGRVFASRTFRELGYALELWTVDGFGLVWAKAKPTNNENNTNTIEYKFVESREVPSLGSIGPGSTIKSALYCFSIPLQLCAKITSSYIASVMKFNAGGYPSSICFTCALRIHSNFSDVLTFLFCSLTAKFAAQTKKSSLFGLEIAVHTPTSAMDWNEAETHPPLTIWIVLLVVSRDHELVSNNRHVLRFPIIDLSVLSSDNREELSQDSPPRNHPSLSVSIRQVWQGNLASLGTRK
ncbi:acetyl-CoA synthetase [Striga asiatica]|uniref:Acetyl-CoA synthetase n=1 Tax=Striga asiatica TaxID=4170 RepID=A0A5A7RGP1_STRAF|nr:acetyl-CoA synthetase [Striga asiatica]